MYQFDHMVHFVERPEAAMAQLQKEGLHVVSGGKHTAWGTYNALSYFDLAYVELIGIFDEALFLEAAKEKYTLHESYAKVNRKNGFTRFAIRTTTIDEDAKKFATAGIEVFGPQKFSRTREDGSVISWRLLHIGQADTKIDFPFFIEWEEEDEVRREQLINQGTIAPHPLGELQFEEIHFVVPNFKAVEQMAKLCDAPVEMKEDTKTNAQLAIVILNNAKLVFSRPIGEGAVWDYMLEYGYGIHKVVLTGGNEQKTFEYNGALYEVLAK